MHTPLLHLSGPTTHRVKPEKFLNIVNLVQHRFVGYPAWYRLQGARFLCTNEAYLLLYSHGLNKAGVFVVRVLWTWSLFLQLWGIGGAS